MSIPAFSNAAVLTAYDRPFEIKLAPVPGLHPQGVLVKVKASTMCGTDVHIWRGAYAEVGLSKLPMIPGHEIVG